MNDDVTVWIESLKAGNDNAAQDIWERYCDKLMRLAKRRLDSSKKREADEEDVVVDAFDSFCRATKERRWPKLTDRHDLWKILITITIRKANAQLKRERAQKRGEGAVRGESVFLGQGDEVGETGLANVLGSEPSPELAASVTETYKTLMESLQEDSLKSIAQHKCEGYSNEEIANQLNYTTRTIRRKLEQIRDIWEQTLS